VKGTAEAAIYDVAAVHNDVIADLDKLVKPGDVLAKGSLTTPPCAVTQANVNGHSHPGLFGDRVQPAAGQPQYSESPAHREESVQGPGDR